MALERDLVRKALAWIRTQPDCWATKIHGGPFQTRGIADVIGHAGGRFLWAEAKLPGEKLTPCQEAANAAVLRSGARPFVFHTIEEFKSAVEELRRGSCP